MELEVGNTYYMTGPFYILEVNHLTYGWVEWKYGCIVTDEDDASSYNCARFFTANGEGRIEYEILAIVDMPKPFIDRVVFKKTMFNPDNNKHGRTSIEILTKNRFLKHVNSRTVFGQEYEIED